MELKPLRLKILLIFVYYPVTKKYTEMKSVIENDTVRKNDTEDSNLKEAEDLMSLNFTRHDAFKN